MNGWYYSNDGQQYGPVSRQQIGEMLASGTLEAGALVWTEGMPEWQAASAVPGLVPAKPAAAADQSDAGADALSPYAPPAAAVGGSAEIDWSGYEPSGPQVRPWIRYWARSFDFLLFSVIFGGAVAVFVPGVESMNDTLFGVLLLFAYNFAEPALLALFGTTPFKALLCVRVRNQDGSKLSYLQGLRRMMAMWVNGQGLGIPLVQLFACLHSYNRLTKDGITSWDKAGPFTVSHQTLPWWRVVLAFAALVGFVTLITIGTQVEV